MLPPMPAIFHGRGSELEKIVKQLRRDSARIAILGMGGMGKTSLAAAVLQDPAVVAKYPCRYFVPCHSTVTCTDLAASIASHVGLDKGPNIVAKLVRHLKSGPAALLMLDNFETPWEPADSRAEVEVLLAHLTNLKHLALVITMRGAERPGGVKWSHPFLPPLKPLDDWAAMQTFIDIADDSHENGAIQELLDFTGNLPLAVSLIASVAGHEGCDVTLARWKNESTRLLSDGYDKKSSLDISIMLSFSSARMTYGAQQLLSILSLLPDGLSDTDSQFQVPIPNVLASKAILLRTSLAYLGKNQRLTALVPIREHIRAIYPP
ncbi:P-loop containing nucleoside triphosphate hydrolase protein, partial [Mycena vulgaris]